LFAVKSFFEKYHDNLLCVLFASPGNSVECHHDFLEKMQELLSVALLYSCFGKEQIIAELVRISARHFFFTPKEYGSGENRILRQIELSKE
jgi:hypothetical protein